MKRKQKTRSRKRKGTGQQAWGKASWKCEKEGEDIIVEGGVGGGAVNRQMRRNSLEGVTGLVNACNRSLEGNCQSGLPEVFPHFYLWQTMWF